MELLWLVATAWNTGEGREGPGGPANRACTVGLF